MAHGFKFLLTLPDGSPPDPAVFVTQSRTGARAKSSRSATGSASASLDINLELDEDRLEELYEKGINGMWIVEPV